VTIQEWWDDAFTRTTINEGLRLKAYRDKFGYWTIGIGHNLITGSAKSLTDAGIKTTASNLILGMTITPAQAQRLFENDFVPCVTRARGSLIPGVFDFLSDARRYVLADLEFNLGDAGWLQFANTRSLINQAQQAKNKGKTKEAHALFLSAGDHLMVSDYYKQVGNRAKRNVAMLRMGIYCDPSGDGSDIYTNA
jgi:GH24 family phage-related lysozyme (muramidase)